MTEENKNEIETAENPQSAADEPASETVKAQLQDTAPGIARDAEAAVAFPAQVTAALEYAAANQYEYGPRLHDVELTWDVISAETMVNDIVRVRLQYSPATSFRGDPGVEYMDVDPDGAILARRQVRVPKENKPVVLMGITALSVVLAVFVISLMTVLKPESGDPLYVAGRVLWIRAERPVAEQNIVYTGASTSGKINIWEMNPVDTENNVLVYVKVRLINQSSGTASILIDENAADLLDGNRKSYEPLNSITNAHTADAGTEVNVAGFIPMWGSIELNNGQEVSGMLVFELPRGSSFTELRWNAADSATIHYR